VKVKVNGVTDAPLKMLPAKQIDCQGEENGCFKYDYEHSTKDGVLTIDFTCRILINQALKGKELASVKEHENRHFADFRTFATALEKSLQAVPQDKDPDMENRMEWFEYDVNEAFNRYHRSIGKMPVVKLPPNNDRPNP